MSTYFISDTHFGHANALKFDNRPWDDIETADAEMIRRWNSKVNAEDHVYILGDFAFRNEKPCRWYTDQLNGHLHLIRGNHDKRTEQYESCFEEVVDYKDLPITLNGSPARVILSHFFMPFYVGHKRNAYMLHGHTHRSEESRLEEELKERIRAAGIRCEAYNCGCMWQDYEPQTLEEIIARQIIPKEELTYKKVGDYYIPNLAITDPVETIGKYGMLRETYLRDHRGGIWTAMSLNGTLGTHLKEVDREANERMETLTKALLEKNPAPPKEKDHLQWAQHMNMIRHQAEEVVLEEIIYA